MKLNRKLNMVLKVELDDGRTVHVHSTPISHEVFEQYFFVMSQAFNAIFTAGIGTVTGPRVAAMMLRRCAEQSGEWPEVEAGLLGEIRRLTHVLVPSATGGYDMMPLDVALSRDLLHPEDASEVMNACVFFTLVSCINRARDRAGMLDTLTQFWGASITSSGITEYLHSLKTSKSEGNTGESVSASTAAAPAAPLGPGSFTVSSTGHAQTASTR